MKLYVTGATGFLGQAVVESALAHGHRVRAMTRTGNDLRQLTWSGNSNCEVSAVDLRTKNGLVEALQGIDCVIHLAAAKAGDMYAQYAGTVVATENLLWAMKEAGVRHIVHCSTFSVYDYRKIPTRSELNEDSPIEENAFARDEYAHTKLVQERLVRESVQTNGWKFTILRPAAIWGQDHHFSARIGINAGKYWFKFGGGQRLPITYVENCADAFVLAAERPEANGQTLNVIDDDPLTVSQYCKRVAPKLSPQPRIIRIPYWIMRLLAWKADWVNRHILSGKAKIPGIFSPAKLAARGKSLKFSNARIKRALGWSPRFAFDESLRRCLTLRGHIDPLSDAVKRQLG